MTSTHVRTPTRARRAMSAATLGMLTAALAVAPASGAEGCDGLAADAEDYAAELECASAAAEGAQVITLTDSFTVPSEHPNLYDGAQPLIIEGAHSGVTISGPGQQDDSSLFVSIAGSLDDPPAGPQEAPAEESSASPAVTVRDLTITQFANAIVNFAPGTLTVEGLTADSNGMGFDSGDGVSAGGAVASAGAVTVSDSRFTNNENAYGGAVSTMLALTAAAADGAEIPPITVTNSTFTGNSGALGGAVLSLGDTTVTGSTFSRNSALYGGALGAFGATADVSNSTFTGNTAAAIDDMDDSEDNEGGAIAVGGALTLSDSVVTDNSSGGVGGAIAFSYGPVEHDTSLTIVDSTIDRNTAVDGGGAVWFEGALDISGSTLAGNSSANGPSAVLVEAAGGDVTVINATFAGNESGAAAPALAIQGAGSAGVTHATFADNSAVSGAADLGVIESGLTTLTASAWTSGGTEPACAVEGDLSTAANFDADGSCTDGWSGMGDIGDGLDAGLGALADNGGSTATLLPATTSPLVDAVVDGASEVSVDQRGAARPQGDAHDIGAVELEPQGASVGFEVTTDQGIVHGTASPALAVTGVEWIPTGDLDTPPPADTALPYGAAGFTVEVPQDGDSVTITLTAPRPFTTLLKSTDGGWSEVEGATFSNGGTTVTYTLTDGGDLDEDGEANGFIVDPVALAVQATFTG